MEDATDIELPSVDDIKLPEISLPDISLPDMPSLPSLGGGEAGGAVDDTLIMGVGAAVLLVGVLAAMASSLGDDGEANSSGGASAPKKKRKTKQQQLLEIDYHAAAKLAYQTWLDEHPDQKSIPGAYEAFETLYEEHAVALATAKKMARDLQAFDNTPVKPIPERRITPKKAPTPPVTEGEASFFFASD